ncbi:MAG TPA: YcaO-like family protein [Reyranella sp.]|jgi:ribosomal protein S12 methylthiotransferase accessory factor
MSPEQHTYEYWLGAPETKYSLSGVERTVRPSVTIKRARRVMEAVGVTKVAEVTDLDRVGIPNFMTVRPHDAAQGISYYSGKGTTRADAHAGALMEAVERHAGESYTGPIVPSSAYNLRGDYPCVDPLEIHAPLIAGYSEDLLLEWVPGFDLLNRQSALVPLNCVVAPYQPIAGEQLFFTSTNGLASGNTRLEALCHALCEVVERDAMAVALARSAIRPVVESILADMGFSAEGAQDGGAPDLSLKGLPRKAAALVRKLQQAGLGIRLRNLTSGTGIPTISCTIVDPQAPPTALNAHSGCGTHPDARIALTRALTEAAQTRVTFIQGGREDLAEMAPNRGASSAAELQTAERTIAFGEIRSHEHPSINEDVEFMLERLRRSGFGQVIVVDLTKAEIGIPVVRVIVPRAETWSFFFMHTGRASVGRRALDQIQAPG